MALRVVYMPIALEHLRSLSARERKTVVTSVKEQLEHEPSVPTRNRKKLRPNQLADWELRVGDFRVLYDIEPIAENDSPAFEGTVVILAVGVKRGSRLWINNEEFEL